MKIDKSSADRVYTEQSRDSSRARTGAARTRPSGSSLSTAAFDRVELSAAGRALAAEAARGGPGELTVERVAAVRERILSGAYDSLDIVDEVARRILGSDDY